MKKSLHIFSSIKTQTRHLIQVGDQKTSKYWPENATIAIPLEWAWTNEHLFLHLKYLIPCV